LIITHPDGTHHNYTYDLESPELLGRVAGADKLSWSTATAQPTWEQFTSNRNGLRRHNQSQGKDMYGRIAVVIDATGNITTYEHDAFGRMAAVTDAHGNTATAAFNSRGWKTSVLDADTGTTAWEYNAAGQPLLQTDNKGTTVKYEYDVLGRMAKETTKSTTITWEYDTSPAFGVGKLAKVTRKDAGGWQHSETYEYGEFGRPAKTSSEVTIAGEAPQTFVQTYDEFDTCGRVTKFTGAGGLQLQKDYDASTGHVKSVHLPSAAAAPFWRIGKTDAQGRTLSYALGNGVTSTKTYDSTGEHVIAIVSSPTDGSDTCLQNLQLKYDPVGNLIRREESCINLAAPGSPPEHPLEDLQYDALNRLTNVNVEGASSLRLDYDAIGNIIFKSSGTDGARTYRYCNASGLPPAPHPNVCDDPSTGKCTVCAACCKSYLKPIQSACDSCVASECPSSSVALSAPLGSDPKVCNISTGAQAGPHAVQQLLINDEATKQFFVGTSYIYDKNGAVTNSTENQNNALGQEFVYDEHGQTSSACDGRSCTSFGYSHAGSAVYRKVFVFPTGNTPEVATSTISLGSFQQVTNDDGTKQCRHQVLDSVVVVDDCSPQSTPNRTQSVLYLGFDEQGSVSIVMDASGALLPGEEGRRSYDPFGRRRYGDWRSAVRTHSWGETGAGEPSEAGFTGHHDLGSMNLVHTPARLYDPYLGRFLSADPTIQDVHYTQTLNRYSYAGNNPIALTDPTGFGWLSSAWNGLCHFASSAYHEVVHVIKAEYHFIKVRLNFE
jgi:RHS repeat-associated protein